MRTIILASLLLAVTSATSFAGTPLINARQNAQQHRIFKGVQQGDLTFNETLKLERGSSRSGPEEPGESERRCRYTARARPLPSRKTSRARASS
jgi:hypothetical protein